MVYNLGVDLGTTFVAAAVARPNQIEMFTLGEQSVVTPALVYLLEDGNLITGDAAGRRAVSNPERLGREVKRRLGDPTPIILGGSARPVTELLGALLRDVLAKVTAAHGGVGPERVVLTHPANWGPFRRGLFEQVPPAAGLTDALLVTEPEAAGLHYAGSHDLRDGDVVAVYDLGGGTFDATALRKGPHGVEIVGRPEGIERLGGIDFDEAILSYVNYAGDGVLDEVDLGDARTTIALARLRHDCVQAKEALSVDTETLLPVLLPGRHYQVRLTRAQFEDMVRAQIESTIGALVRTLRSARISPEDLSAVLLVGGSSRIPLVAQMVSAELGRPTVVDTNPKHSVALGAAALAGPPTQNGQPSPRVAQLSTVRGAAATPETPSAAPIPTTAWPPTGPTRPKPAPSAPTTLLGPPRRPADDPPPPPPPAGPPPGNDPPGRAARNRRLAVVGRAAVLVLVTAAAGAALVLMTAAVGAYWAGSHPSSSAAAGTAPAPTAPADRAGVVPSVPVPSLDAPIPVGPTPEFVALSPNGRLAYVANGAAKTVTVADTSINKVIATIPVDAGPPQFLTFSPDGRRVYVSIFDQQRTIHLLGVIDTTTDSIVATIPVRTRPFRAAVTPDGTRVYVPNHDSGTVTIIDAADNHVLRELSVPANPHWIEFNRDGSRAYLANHESNLVSVLDTASDQVIARIPVGTSPHALAVHPTRPLVANVNYDSNTVTMIDTNTNQLVATVSVGKQPQSIRWAPDGRFAYTVNDGDGTLSVIDAATFRVTATIPTGASPTSVAVLPTGRQAYISNLDSGTLTVLNTGG